MECKLMIVIIDITYRKEAKSKNYHFIIIYSIVI